MQTEQIFRSNNFDECIQYLEKYENNETLLRSFIMEHSEQHGMILLVFLTEIANKRNIPFWYIQLAFFYSFIYHFIDGSQKASLFYFLKAHQLDNNNISTLSAIIDFYLLPEVILSLEEAKHFANKILILDPKYQKALDLLNTISSTE